MIDKVGALGSNTRTCVMPYDAYLVTIACTTAVGVGCAGSDPLEAADIAGNYSATTLTVTPPGQPTVDILAAGGILTVVLATDGSTSGLLSVPAGVNGGTAINESMIGTFTLNGKVVRFA